MQCKLLFASLLFTVSLSARAQQATAPTGDAAILPDRGQDQNQQQFDRYECYGWAKKQSGFDPSQPGGRMGQDNYRRAFSACMTGRGYTVTEGAVSPGASPVAPPPVMPPPSPPMYMRQSWWKAPELQYRPVRFAIEGGFTATAGSTGDNLNDGGNIGLGISFFPSRSLPVGLRIDGSWSRFDANRAFYDPSTGSYLHSHENIYGGDVDLQFNLAHPSSRYQFYLLGGAGWYREQSVLDQFSPGCGFHYCGPIYGGEVASATTGWRTSWNAGFGTEFAMPGGSSFFVEARYQQISSRFNDVQLVPVRFGVRF
jgi:Outer membrane protein beta-barrel domain